MPDDKKKQAMSLLFGDAPARPEAAVMPAPAADPPPDAVRSAKARARPEPDAAPAADAQPSPSARSARQPQRGRGGEASVAATPAATPDPYYQGASRYARQAGEQVKHSVYLDPDVSRALKIAAATGDDARGVNVSAIVNAALRELGYGA